MKKNHIIRAIRLPVLLAYDKITEKRKGNFYDKGTAD